MTTFISWILNTMSNDCLISITFKIAHFFGHTPTVNSILAFMFLIVRSLGTVVEWGWMVVAGCMGWDPSFCGANCVLLLPPLQPLLLAVTGTGAAGGLLSQLSPPPLLQHPPPPWSSPPVHPLPLPHCKGVKTLKTSPSTQTQTAIHVC